MKVVYKGYAFIVPVHWVYKGYAFIVPVHWPERITVVNYTKVQTTRSSTTNPPATKFPTNPLSLPENPAAEIGQTGFTQLD